MISELKYKNQEVRELTSMTLTKEDIITLHKEFSAILKDYKPEFKYSMLTKYNRKTLSNPNEIDFLKIRYPIEALVIEINVNKVLEVQLYLTTYQKSVELEGYGSMYSISSSKESILLQFTDYMDKFIHKKKNYHFIVHSYAPYVSFPLAIILLYVFKMLQNINFDIINSIIGGFFIGVMSFYTFTKAFRRVFPYTYFPEEVSRRMKSLKICVLTVVLSIIASGIYTFVSENLIVTMAGGN